LALPPQQSGVVAIGKAIATNEMAEELQLQLNPLPNLLPSLLPGTFPERKWLADFDRFSPVVARGNPDS